MCGWLDQVGIRLTQLSTRLKVEAELGNKIIRWHRYTVYHSYLDTEIYDTKKQKRNPPGT